ncbi:MAG: shikimate kinase, partial [Spirochaetia bacterium]
MSPDRVILIGFMGSGKTTVARILAARMGWELVDTDKLVEARAGAPVTRIFAGDGVRACRAAEAEVGAGGGGRWRVVVGGGGG